MVSRILFWTGFGLATRAWQLGIQMRSPFILYEAWTWPVFGAAGASFGYWLQGVDERQTAIIAERKEVILAKRAKRAAMLREKEDEAVSAI